MLNITITFDYELFFGENNGTNEEVLFAPTERVLDLLDKYNIKATFFADVLSVYMHNKYGLTEYPERFCKQIKDMIRRGHDVQLHIHSNWLNSTYDGEKWHFDVQSYRIHSYGFSGKEGSANDIIKWGKTFLEKELQTVDPQYKCVAFRAGGYCVQPHNELFKALWENGIKIDSSVVFDQKNNGVNHFDFVGMKKQYGWWADAEQPLDYAANPGENTIFEVPIGSIKNNLVRRLLNGNTERDLIHRNMRGTYISLGPVEAKKKHSKLWVLLNYAKQYRFFTVDSVHYLVLMRSLRRLLKQKNDKSKYVAMIGHPKIVDAAWLENFEGLLKKLREDGYVCTTMSGIYKAVTGR